MRLTLCITLLAFSGCGLDLRGQQRVDASLAGTADAGEQRDGGRSGEADSGAEVLDACPEDEAKTVPGTCGCGVPEVPACDVADALTWIELPSGEFEMGSTVAADEQPIHTVRVASFEMTQTEARVAEYLACVQDGACPEPESWSEGCYWKRSGFEAYPINCIDWHAAAAFCEWLGGRLPSEAEWEYAARSAGSSATYPWGDQLPTCARAIMNEGGDGCGENQPAATCSREAGSTAQGLCDMAGNVFEWVQDSWHGTYNGAPNDGRAWVGGSLRRPVRGGGFVSDAVRLRGASRRPFFGATYQNTFIGARCVRSGPP